MLDSRELCAVCAWRAECQKKHTMKEKALHCPDFSKDVSLGAGEAPKRPSERHKQIDDVFGSGKK